MGTPGFRRIFLFLPILLSAFAFSQSTDSVLEVEFTPIDGEGVALPADSPGLIAVSSLSDESALVSSSANAGRKPGFDFAEPVIATATPKTKHERFHWGRALAESAAFLTMQHTYLYQQDANWLRGQGPLFGNYWKNYKTSLSNWASAGWDDGDAWLDNYVGHPIQGALTGYFQVQNDPRGAKLEFANTKQYWHSRLRAMAWSAAYSTQFEMGPLSEMTVEKYGIWGAHPMWDGHVINGVGYVDVVVTPIGGFGWMVGEDLLDRYVVRKVERKTRNAFLVGAARCALNPIRGAANVIHGKAPWYRASRDAKQVYLQAHESVAGAEGGPGEH